MKTSSSLLIAGILGASALASHAAIITWGGAQGISGDSDVSTAGTLVRALNLGGAGVPATSVNGVNFQSFAIPGGTNAVTVGNFTFKNADPLKTVSSTPTSLGQALSVNYTTLLTTAALLNADQHFTLTMAGLTVGRTYQFETWVNNSNRGFFTGIRSFTTSVGDGNGNTVSLYSGDNGVGSGGPALTGQFVIGTFLASSATQDIGFTSGEIDGVVNAFQLRLLPAAAAVPEPGSALAGMLALGVCLSGLGRRNRRETAQA